MDKETALQLISKHPNAISFVKESHLEELSPLVEVHIEVVTVKKEDFDLMTGGSYAPKKEIVDRFGNAAGISFRSSETSTRKEGDSFIGRAIPQEVGPDGKMIVGDACEYEYDPEIRAAEDFINNPDKYDNERAKQLRVLNHKKVGRRRANTGARKAAIISAIGMPTGIKNLFNRTEGDKATREFLFSRIIINTKNELVLNRALESMLGATNQLYGPSEPKLLTSFESEAQPRNVSPADEDPTIQTGFDDIPEPTMDERSELCFQLEQYIMSEILNQESKNYIRGLIENKHTPIETLRMYLNKCKTLQAKKGGAA